MTATLNPVGGITHSEELNRLEILREYKKIFAGDEKTPNRSPFDDDRVVRLDSLVDSWDIPEIHNEARQAIRDNLQELHQGKFSRVVILAGQAGIGKSHLLNYFRDPNQQEELGYVYIGGNNFWKVDEFENYLLTWLVAALTRPSIQGPNLLLTKISDLAFQALEQILDRPGQIRNFLAHKTGWLGRILGKFGPDKHARFQKACDDRDLDIFRKLDFHRFADFVCQQFLRDKTNQFHRFVLFVLLRYLFPEDRSKVCAWLVDQKVQEAFFQALGGPYKNRRDEPRDPNWPTEDQVQAHFLKEFGIADRLNLNYKLIDTLKILVSLFSPEVNRHAPSKERYPGRIFFFAFDQMEGRKELFDCEADWFRFFAKLSELYNALPNVFIVFTMTLQLRSLLYDKMERQFQQHISRDKKFVLTEIEDSEIIAIYRRRLELWRKGKLSQDILNLLLRQPHLELLPFDQEEVLSMGRQKTLRSMLEQFDKCFRDFMNERVVVGADARLEFLVIINELREKEKQLTSFQYTKDHLETVAQLFRRAPGKIAGAYGLTLISTEAEESSNAIKLELVSPSSNGRWVRVFLASLPFRYKNKLPALAQLLFGKNRSRYSLRLVRPGPNPIELDGDLLEREGQVSKCLLDVAVETRLQALHKLLDKQNNIANEPGLDEETKDRFRQEVDHILVEEIKLTYLGEMFQQVAESLENLTEGGDHDED